jgi:hypothetical protein
MHVTINVESPNNISKWQMEFNLAFKGLNNIIRKEFISRKKPLLRQFSEIFAQIVHNFVVVIMNK